mgnify:CR=1 FL=1
MTSGASGADAISFTADAIGSGYTIGFAPPDVQDGTFHHVRVVADAGDGRPLIAHTRAGYMARPAEPPAR